ncbi:hypothetical protein BX600DRAFT_321629 [Xylariales sp. PMI_506]|nr:hypothetical protein BX600DRAFT_321629 [Xylariales sp. PMI_506]
MEAGRSSETTPLLAGASTLPVPDTVEILRDGDTSPDDNDSPASVIPPPHRIRSSMWASMVVAVLTLVFALVLTIMGTSGPPGFTLSWSLRELLNAIFILTIAAVIVAVLNLRFVAASSKAWAIILSLFLDVLVVINLLPLDASLINFFHSSAFCYTRRGDPVATPECLAYRKAVLVIVGFAASLTTLLVLIHVYLFVLRLVELSKRSRGQVPHGDILTLRITIGSILFETSLRLLGTEQQQGSVAEEV